MQLHEPDRNASVFAALGDPTRLMLLGRLGREERSLSALAEGAGMSRQAITKHLDVLARAGLVHSQRRGRECRFTATPGPLLEATDWLRAYRQQWEDAFDRLDDYLQTLPEDPTK
ncbi:MAG: metalloregulator ArsR/SmtB family transcription factor [Pseudomonadota bacterium]|nr:metalloregulator ArsR/SmtB family transcription factor [Pseudomonadota bacterium]